MTPVMINAYKLHFRRKIGDLDKYLVPWICFLMSDVDLSGPELMVKDMLWQLLYPWFEQNWNTMPATVASAWLIFLDTHVKNRGPVKYSNVQHAWDRWDTMRRCLYLRCYSPAFLRTLQNLRMAVVHWFFEVWRLIFTAERIYPQYFMDMLFTWEGRMKIFHISSAVCCRMNIVEIFVEIL